MIAVPALAFGLTLASLSASQDLELPKVWRSYLEAENGARGLRSCPDWSREWLATNFERRFARRAAALKSAADAKLGRFEADEIATQVGKDAIGVCASVTTLSQRQLRQIYVLPFEKKLASTETRFRAGHHQR